jgi:hypothetical protein
MKYNIYDSWIDSLRPEKSRRPLSEPVGAWTEAEIMPDGRRGTVGTIIINNRQCPYRCVMCGLWRDTVDFTPEVGQVADQVSTALAKLGAVDSIKLYNAGSFFDEQALPREDWPAIARACQRAEWVTVESRPDLIDERAAEFGGLLSGRLEVAVGLETTDRTVLALLNKRMTPADYERGTRFLNENSIPHRAFIMVKPPLVNEARALELGMASIDFAVRCGATTVSLIPTYITPGAMERLTEAGFAIPPSPWSLYRLAAYGLRRRDVNVLVDTWPLDLCDGCDSCLEAMRAAFQTLNERQELPPVRCACQEDYERRLKTEMVGDAASYRRWLKRQLKAWRASWQVQQ